MIKITNLNMYMDDQIVLEDINMYFGRETYLLNGQMHKRKTLFIDKLATSFIKYNSNIEYVGESGIVYLPRYQILMQDLTVQQNIDFFAKFFNTPSIKVKVIINHFELDNFLNRKIDSLSSDTKQLVRIVCVFLNINASVYLLDNITEHLSRAQIDLVKMYLKQVDTNCTLIFSKLNSHGIEEFNPRILNIVDKKFVYEEK
ncbi:hypothetical protein RZE82_00530 [Mollicutes bacterium LVI A0039]|nr:hypothetical protein RZE82_00530 [Mollicutes bacterium LVI A0039]